MQRRRPHPFLICLSSTCQYEPVADDPPCPRCTPDLVGAPAPRRVPCRYCGAERVTLYDLASDELKVPDVSMEDCCVVLTKSTTSVAQRELKKYTDFTAEFGSEGQ